MNCSDRRLGVRAAGVLALGLAAGPAAADWALNMTPGVTEVSRDVFGLHMLIFWICVIIGVVVFGAIVYSVIKFRKSKGAQAAQFHHSTTVEIIWTVIPLLILVGMAVPATKTLIAMDDVSQADMTVKVTGYQWQWHYEYMDEGVGFYSKLDADSDRVRQVGSGEDPRSVDNYLLNVDEPLVLPTDTRVRFLITAADVIHSWWVPDLGWKKDAIPGYVNTAWTQIDEPGIYRGQCAELCGRDHGFMPVVVEAKTPEDFQAWLAARKPEPRAGADGGGEAGTGAAAGGQTVAAADGGAAPEPSGPLERTELMSRGESVYGTHCAACHQANGQGVPNVFPALAGGAITTGDVGGHLDIVLNGKSGTAMAAFGAQLSDADIAAVITYERNAFGNDTGDVVQPADVRAAR